MATYDETKVDDAAFTPATDRVYPIGAMLDDAATDSVDEGDVGIVRMTADRKLLVSSGTAASDLGKAEDSVHGSGDTGVMALAVRSDFGAASGANGDYVAVPVGESSSIAGVSVHVVGDDDKYVRGAQAHNAAQVGGPVVSGLTGQDAAPTAVTNGVVTNAWGDRNGRTHITGDTAMTALLMTGTQAAGSGSGTNVVTVQGVAGMNPLFVTGELAHDAVDSGNPVKLGAKAIAHGTNPTAVAANDRTQLYANRAGIPWVIGGHPNIVSLELSYSAAQTDVAIITVGAGAKIVVTEISVSVDSEVTVSNQVRIGFGATNTPTTTGVVFSHPGMGIGVGGPYILFAQRGSGAGIIGIGADGEDLRITADATTGGTARVVVSYYTIES